MKKLYIYGSGTISREVIRLVKNINEKKKIWKICGIVEKNISTKKNFEGFKIFDENKIKFDKNSYAVIALSDVKLKHKIDKNLKKKKIKLVSLIHPDVHLYKNTKIGNGSIIFSNSQIGYKVVIGQNSLISFGVDIGHHVKINQNCTILPNTTIGGYVKIGKRCLLGSGTNILPKVTINENCVIGIGSTIIKNVKKNQMILVNQRQIILPRKSEI